MFNLNEAIANWRASLAQRETCRPSDLDELEGHLRDEFENLRISNLSDEERFVVATHRLGAPAPLAGEFAKINGTAIWGNRIFWMAVGLLTWFVLEPLAEAVSKGCVLVAALEGFTSNELGWVAFLSKAFVLGGMLLLLGRAAVRSALGAKFGQLAKSRIGQVMLFSAVAGAIAVLWFLEVYIVPLAALRSLGLEHFARTSSSATYASMAWMAIVPMVLAIAVIRLRPSRPREIED
jgi:hypothetical protein